MRRNLAIAGLLVGTIFFGVATGYVYLDLREIEIRRDRARGWEAADLERFEEAKREYIARALVLGPLGAGLMLAGMATVILELPWFRRKPG